MYISDILTTVEKLPQLVDMTLVEKPFLQTGQNDFFRRPSTPTVLSFKAYENTRFLQADISPACKNDFRSRHLHLCRRYTHMPAKMLSAKKKATTPTHRRPPLFGRAIVAPPPELGGRGRGRVGEPHHRRRPRRGRAAASMMTRKTTTSSTSKVRPRLTITGFIVPMRRGRRIRRTHASPSPDLPSLPSAVVGYTTPVHRCCQIPPPPPSNHAPQPRSATAAPFPTTAASSTLSESEGEEMRREGVGT